MSHPRGTDLMWADAAHGLQLRVGTRGHAVPNRITAQLLQHFPQGLTLDPAADLLELERHQRWTVLNEEQGWEQAERQVTVTRAACTGERRHRRRRCTEQHRQVMSDQLVRVGEAQRARANNRELRRFIIALGLAHGPLANARRGWLLPSERPGTVQKFAGEADFLEVDRRRAVTKGWGGGAINADVVGTQWRREGDDNPAVPDPGESGMWTVGYVHPTREVYAHWLGEQVPEEIWLMGSGIGPEILTRLRQLQRGMREPNSLMRVVRAVDLAPYVDGTSRCPPDSNLVSRGVL
jgi:hypothetical protein